MVRNLSSRERLAAAADPLLAEEHRPRRVELDRDRDHGQQRARRAAAQPSRRRCPASRFRKREERESTSGLSPRIGDALDVVDLHRRAEGVDVARAATLTFTESSRAVADAGPSSPRRRGPRAVDDHALDAVARRRASRGRGRRGDRGSGQADVGSRRRASTRDRRRPARARTRGARAILRTRASVTSATRRRAARGSGPEREHGAPGGAAQRRTASTIPETPKASASATSRPCPVSSGR